MSDDRGALVQLGAFCFDRGAKVLKDDQNRRVALRPQSLSVLAALIARAGEIAPRDALIEEVWGSVAVTDDSLIQCIADIRRALGSDGHAIVQTIPKKGYRLVAPAPVDMPSALRAKRRHLALAATCLLVIMGFVGAWIYLDRPKPDEGGATIAVLPFANIGGDDSQMYFTDGFTKAITTNISKFEDLFVISSFSAFKYRGSEKQPRVIADELGVHYLLTGDVRPGPDKILINAQLTDAHSGKALWAERYDARRTDVFDLQDDLSAKIAATLVERMETVTTRRARSADRARLNAYELLLRAANPKVEKDALYEAIHLIEQAVRIDPDFSRAYAEMAENYMLLWRHSLSDDHDATLRKARAVATRAIELDNNSYRSHQVLSMIYLYADKDHSQAHASIARALEINPNEADLMVRMATLLGFMNRDAEAITWSEKAMRQNPLHPAWYHWNAAFVHAVAGENGRAVLESKKALAVYKTSASIRRILIAAHGDLGQWDEAKRYASEIMSHNPEFRLSTHMRNSPFQDPVERERYWNLFRRAGLPD